MPSLRQRHDAHYEIETTVSNVANQAIDHELLDNISPQPHSFDEEHAEGS
jgi:hypothetical protein